LSAQRERLEEKTVNYEPRLSGRLPPLGGRRSAFAVHGEDLGAVWSGGEWTRAPLGLALDLGTGSGIWAVQLAKRGWQVTGVELVEKALRRAHDRVQAPKPIEVLLRPDEHWYRLRRKSATRSD
jgi:SAM-dependent methyltransferase